MLMDQNINKSKREYLLSLLSQFKFGIEIEEHRVQLSTGTLSKQTHPKNFGPRKFNSHFQTDFSESQEELITAPHPSSEKALEQLYELQMILAQSLQNDELIWPLSMPPHLNSNDINYLLTHFERSWYQEYRDYLIEKYGPYQHIMAGVHVSVSVPDELINWFHSQNKTLSHVEAKNLLYFQIAQHIVAYRWVFTFLFGAGTLSENEDDGLPRVGSPDYKLVRSWRSSNLGFSNRPDEKVYYENFENYINQLETFVKNNVFYDQSEFYGPVRLKGNGKISDLKTFGTNYLEFRIFDIDPYSTAGISQNALDTLHLLIMDAVINPKIWTAEELYKTDIWNNTVALDHPSDRIEDDEIHKAFVHLIDRLHRLSSDMTESMQQRFKAAIAYVVESQYSSELTVSGKLQNEIKHGSLSNFALSRGKINLTNLRNDFNHFIEQNESINRIYILALQLGIETRKLNQHQLYVKFNNKSGIVNSRDDLLKFIDLSGYKIKINNLTESI